MVEILPSWIAKVKQRLEMAAEVTVPAEQMRAFLAAYEDSQTALEEARCKGNAKQSVIEQYQQAVGVFGEQLEQARAALRERCVPLPEAHSRQKDRSAAWRAAQRYHRSFNDNTGTEWTEETFVSVMNVELLKR